MRVMKDEGGEGYCRMGKNGMDAIARLVQCTLDALIKFSAGW